MTAQMDIPWRTRADALVDPDQAPASLPYVYRANGGPSHPLTSWGHASDLLHLVGLHDSLSFVLFERAVGGDRWVQALGAAERMVVEVARGDGPMRVARREADSPRDDVVSVQGFRVAARASEQWAAGTAAAIARAWLTSGSLPEYLDAQLVPPLDWAG